MLSIFFVHNSYEDAVELLLKHGARVDVEARMCWPGPHQHNCEVIITVKIFLCAKMNTLIFKQPYLKREVRIQRGCT